MVHLADSFRAEAIVRLLLGWTVFCACALGLRRLIGKFGGFSECVDLAFKFT